MVRAARPEEAALDRRVDRLGAGAAAARRRRHRPRDLRADDEHHRQAPHRSRPRRRARRGEARRGGQARPAARAPSPASGRPATGGERALPRARGAAAAFCEELRSEGVAVGTSEILDAFEALEEVPWTEPARLPRGAGGDAREVAGGPPRLRAALRPLLLPRRRGRGARAGVARGSATRATERLDLDELREAVRQAIVDGATARCATSPGSRSPPSGAAARARAWSASTCSGSGARSGSRPRGARPTPTARSRRSTARASSRFERHLRRELERATDRAHREAAAVPPAGRARPRAADQPDPGPRRGAPRRRSAQAPPRDARPRAARAAAAARAVDMRRTMRASLETGGVPLRLTLPAEAPPPARDLRALRRLHLGHLGAASSSSRVLHALHDSFRKLRSFVFIERISEVTEVFERERDFRKISERISRDGGVADVSGYTDYGRVWLEFLERDLRRPRTRARR